MGSLWAAFDWQKIINKLEEELNSREIIDLNSAKEKEQQGLLTKAILKIIRPVLWKWLSSGKEEE